MKGCNGRTDLRILRGEHNHTGIQPLHLFPIKEDYTTGKAERLHSEKSKQTIEADCRFGGEISNYLSTALKGWDIWVSNRLPGSHSAERVGREKLSGRKKQPYHWGINFPLFSLHIFFTPLQLIQQTSTTKRLLPYEMKAD